MYASVYGIVAMRCQFSGYGVFDINILCYYEMNKYYYPIIILFFMNYYSIIYFGYKIK